MNINKNVSADEVRSSTLLIERVRTLDAARRQAGNAVGRQAGIDLEIAQPFRSDIRRGKSGESADWSFQVLFAILRRYSQVIAISILTFFVLGVAYLVLATPKYTATARMVIDTKTERFFPETPTADRNNVDTGVIDSQIEILRSETIAAAVVQKLKLTQDPEFQRSSSVSERIIELITLRPIFGRSDTSLTSQDRELHIAITNFERSSSVNRIGRSYVAEINFTSANPEKAALIANAIADAYIDNQLDARIYNSQRADAWIRRRIAELKENYAAASSELNKFKATVSATAQKDADHTSSRLRELESTVDSYKSVYETFVSLSRYVQSVQEQSFPITDARIITKAVPPQAKSPRTGLTLAASLMLGGLIGTAFALVQGFRNQRLFTPNQLEQHFGAPCVGLIPTVDQQCRLSSSAANTLRSLGIAALLDDCDSSAGAGEVLRALRSIIDARMPSNRCCVIGITSARRKEGKTTLAANLAAVIHEVGRRVLLVDGDLRNHSISDGIAAAQRHSGIATPIDEGLYAVAGGTVKLEDVIVSGPFGWCLPVEATKSQLKHPADFWSSSDTKKLFVTAKAQYDYIIVDLPPLLDHIDAEAAATLFDTFIFVAEYANTKIDDLASVFNSSETVANRLLGVIVNNVPIVAKHRHLKLIPNVLR